MKLRFMVPAFASLLLAGTLAYAAPAPQSSTPATEVAPAIFAAESQDCLEAQSPLAGALNASDPYCGLCSAPACQGASWLAYCGVRFGNPMYCQPTTACTGEGIGKYRCVCQVGDPILP